VGRLTPSNADGLGAVYGRDAELGAVRRAEQTVTEMGAVVEAIEAKDADAAAAACATHVRNAAATALAPMAEAPEPPGRAR
jgi:DNA-binding GntR family transcriptional regulator